MKREPVDEKLEPNGWLANALRQSPPTGESCLDMETLAAWADGGLNAPLAAAVELHASNCARCTALLATMARTAPVPEARHVWTPARLARWGVPIAAAATAAGLWIVVPDRPVTPVPARDLQSSSERADAAKQSEGPVPVPVPGSTRRAAPAIPLPERGTRNQNLESGSRNPEPAQLRDEMRREAAKPETFGTPVPVESPSAAAAPAPPPPLAAPMPPPPSAQAPVTQPSVSTDRLAETAATAKRSAFNSTTISSESIAPNSLVRWRVVAGVSLERSTDGGETWTRRTPPPGVAPTNSPAITLVILRAVDADRAVVRTSNGVEFYTTNGGTTWTRMQENSPAPF